MSTHPLIAAAIAAPHTHKVVTTYVDGTTREHPTRSDATAEMYAAGERQKLGRDLIDRSSGKTVRVVNVSVSQI